MTYVELIERLRKIQKSCVKGEVATAVCKLDLLVMDIEKEFKIKA